MRRILAPLAAVLMFSAAPVFADERQDLVASILSTAPLPCNDAAIQLLNQQGARLVAVGVLNGVRQGAQLDAGFAPGNPHYDQARALIDKAVQEDEQRNGMLLGFTVQNVMQEAFSAHTLDDLRYFAAFFARPEGRLYWEELLGGAQCQGWLKALNAPPFLPLTGEAKLRWEQLNDGLKGAEQRFLSRLHALPQPARAEFDQGHVRLRGTFDDAYARLNRAMETSLKNRLDIAVKPHIPALLEFVRQYRESK